MLGGRRVTVDASNTLAYAAGMRPRVLDLLIDYAVDDAVRKPIQEVPLRAEEAGPTLRRCDDLRDRVVYREDELPTETAASSVRRIVRRGGGRGSPRRGCGGTS